MIYHNIVMIPIGGLDMEKELQLIFRCIVVPINSTKSFLNTINGQNIRIGQLLHRCLEAIVKFRKE